MAVNAVVGGGGEGGAGCRGPLGVAGEVRVIWLHASMFECPMGARVVVVGVAGRGGLGGVHDLSWSFACCRQRQ